MSDDTELNGMEQPEMAEAAGTVAPKASSGDFLSTTAGKAVLISVAVLVLLVIAGAVGWFVLGPASLGDNVATPSVVPPVTGTPAIPSTPTSSTVATLPIAPITSRDVFTPRNPFEVIKPATISAGSTTSDSSTDGTSTIDPDDVILDDIVTVNSVRKAVLLHAGGSQTLGVGESIVGHPTWVVEAVNTSSVDIRFDDVTVRLTVGQGSSK